MRPLATFARRLAAPARRPCLPNAGVLRRRVQTVGLLLLTTLFAFALQGYHPGTEDDGIYLSAIKKDLHPSLYPYNSEFFTIQVKATIFDKVVAASARWTHGIGDGALPR